MDILLAAWTVLIFLYGVMVRMAVEHILLERQLKELKLKRKGRLLKE